MGTTYDSRALLAAQAHRRELWVLHARSLLRGERPVVPAAVLAQTWRGGPQAALSRLLRGCVVEDLDEPRARAAGIVCARSGTRDIVDAVVVAGALTRGDLVVTSDADDLERIASALGGSIRSHRI
ncbi:MAG TPA: twitching motility protein PilT [Gammaproteobacteria bacterium]|nr:twitching motility protein PilT [Gammaproteobacteria bacterium]